MTEFSDSRWAQKEFSQEYRDNADIFIVDRRKMIDIMKSFYRYNIFGNGEKTILDLGCGDGILTHNLLDIDGSISATLVDASVDMLGKAEERLAEFGNIHPLNTSFQDIIKKDVLHEQYDFIVSSFAIHHLLLDEKNQLFQKIHDHLKQDGYFLNIDTVLPPTDTLEAWYFYTWKEWIDTQKTEFGLNRDIFSDLTRRYKDADENRPDTLEDQLSALRQTGFNDVDCYYKNGIFAMYGGRK